MQLISRLRSKYFKVIFVTLAAIYLLFSIGVMKATHFCMGREASVTFFSGESQKCGCSLFAGENDSCCDDEHELLKIKDDQNQTTGYTIQIPQLYILEDLYTERLITSRITQDSDDGYP